MQKRAFTFLEVTIAIAIISIIMSVMLVTLHPEKIRSQYLNKSSKVTLVRIEFATRQILAKNSINGYLNKIRALDNSTFSITDDDATSKLNLLYKKYLVGTRKVPLQNEYLNIHLKDANNRLTNYQIGRFAGGFHLKNGSYFGLYLHGNCTTTEEYIYDPLLPNKNTQKNSCGLILFDTNGEEAPNTLGVDIFLVSLGSDGVIDRDKAKDKCHTAIAQCVEYNDDCTCKTCSSGNPPQEGGCIDIVGPTCFPIQGCATHPTYPECRCTECIEPYVLSDGTCVPPKCESSKVQYCISYDPDNCKCTACGLWFTLSGEKCVETPCDPIANCYATERNLWFGCTCSQCNDGYHQKEKAGTVLMECEKDACSIENCENYDSDCKCTACKTCYSPSDDGSSCIQHPCGCSQPIYTNIEYCTAGNNDTGCSAGAGDCTACRSPYVLNYNGSQCCPAISHCTAYGSDYSGTPCDCADCESPYMKNVDGTDCCTFISGCIAYDSDCRCVDCGAMVLQNGTCHANCTTITSVETCNNQYGCGWFDSCQSCALVTQGGSLCADCNGTDWCTSCVRPYKLYAGACYTCDQLSDNACVGIEQPGNDGTACCDSVGCSFNSTTRRCY